MGILEILDCLPEAVARSPAQVWSVLARSLGEQGADGRTAFAWRWILTGNCPSPVSLALPGARPPTRRDIIDEANAEAELGRRGADQGGQVMQARFVLEWLAGRIDALPLWNGGPKDLHVTDGAAYAGSRARTEEVYFWGLLAQERYPWCDASGPASERLAASWARGALDLMTWVCGEAAEGPLSGTTSAGRPTLYTVAQDASRGMAGIQAARQHDDPPRARRLEAVMETFLWLAGWNPEPPVDRHGHGSFDACPERAALCGCNDAGRCLRSECAACWRSACVPAARATRAR
jgi:hypothetical protein